MSVNNVLYVPPCPTTCSGAVAEVSFSECAPEYHWGEISKLYIVESDFESVDNAGNAGFSDVTSLTEWNDNLSDTVDNKIRTLIVIGELPEPERLEVPASGDRIAIGQKTFNLNFAIDETNDTNYGFLLQTECGGKFLIWFETSDGQLYGGNAGIEASIVLNQAIPRERNAIVTIVGKATWKSQFSPFRCDSPLA
jgi:hypothetical protein